MKKATARAGLAAIVVLVFAMAVSLIGPMGAEPPRIIQVWGSVTAMDNYDVRITADDGNDISVRIVEGRVLLEDCEHAIFNLTPHHDSKRVPDTRGGYDLISVRRLDGGSMCQTKRAELLEEKRISDTKTISKTQRIESAGQHIVWHCENNEPCEAINQWEISPVSGNSNLIYSH